MLPPFRVERPVERVDRLALRLAAEHLPRLRLLLRTIHPPGRNGFDDPEDGGAASCRVVALRLEDGLARALGEALVVAFDRRRATAGVAAGGRLPRRAVFELALCFGGLLA